MGGIKSVWVVVSILLLFVSSVQAISSDWTPFPITLPDSIGGKLNTGCQGVSCVGKPSVDPAEPPKTPSGDLLTGKAVTGDVIREIERGGKVQRKYLKIRKYPLDLSITSNISLGEGDVVDFFLDGTKYLMIVSQFNKDNAYIRFMPTKEYTNLTPGELKVYDVNHDGKPDFQAEMGSVKDNEAYFVIGPPGSKQSPLTPVSGMVEIDMDLPTPSMPSQQQGESFIPSAPVQAQTPPENPAGPLIRDPSQIQQERAQQVTQSSSGFGMVGWAMIFAGFGVILILIIAAVILAAQKKKVEEVTKYTLDSLAHQVPLPTIIKALSDAGWKQSIIDAALAQVASKYKSESIARGSDPSAMKDQLFRAGMPEQVLKKVF